MGQSNTLLPLVDSFCDRGVNTGLLHLKANLPTSRVIYALVIRSADDRL